MRDGDGVEAGNAASPEIGCDDVFSEVELGGGAPDGASGVDEQGGALGRYEQDRVAFADVDGCDFK